KGQWLDLARPAVGAARIDDIKWGCTFFLLSKARERARSSGQPGLLCVCMGRRRAVHLAMTIKGVFLDFGFVIGYPTAGIDRKYFYLDWDGIDTVIKDREMTQHLRPGVGRAELEALRGRICGR
ncbi:MAG: hypothetical protein JXA89_03100, partial [Anaerolineae bacterium]|nr:hypothetical protein [Anaerolineae bacterium]